MDNEGDFIGTGWSFPPDFDRDRGEVVMSTGPEDIDASLHILLSTTIGERVMLPEYGCNLKKFLFDPLNASMEAYIEKLVGDAILYFEPRIRLNDLEVEVEDGRMEITVDYSIKSSSSRHSFVFPFYLSKGVQP